MVVAKFDVERLKIIGPEVVIGEAGPAPMFAVSKTGVLAYMTSPAAPDSLVRMHRDGRQVTPIIEGSSGFLRYPRVSPDGTRLAVTLGPVDRGDVWIYDL